MRYQRLVFCSVLILVGNLSGQTIPPRFLPLAQPGFTPQYGTNSLAIGDIDRDGDLDLILGLGNKNKVLLNDGYGMFTDVTATHIPSHNDNTTSVALGDVDGDGDLDLVAGNDYEYGPFGPTKGNNRLYLNDGKGNFSEPVGNLPVTWDSTQAIGLADLDGDGDLDLVVANRNSPVFKNKLYLNNGKGFFTDRSSTHLPNHGDSTQALILGDLDGDGDQDIVFGNYQANRLYLNDGKAKFTEALAGSLQSSKDSTWALARGDVDGDGDLDLLVGNRVSVRQGAPNRLYLNNGKAKFVEAPSGSVPGTLEQTMALLLVDVNGDGNLDLIEGHHEIYNVTNTGKNLVHFGDGQGRFKTVPNSGISQSGSRTNALAFGDLDGDGDGDLLVGNYPPMGIHFNLLRHIECPTPPKLGQNLVFNCWSLPPGGPGSPLVIPIMGLGLARIPIPPFGTLMLNPSWLLLFPSKQVFPSSGYAGYSLPVPNVPVLRGQSVYLQGLVEGWGGSGKTLGFTNLWEAKIQ